MTKTQRNRLSDYVRHMANELGLRDWTLTIRSATADDGYHAQITVEDQSKHAAIRFSDDFWAESADQRRATVLHELLHCHLNALTCYFEDLTTSCGRATTDPVSRAHLRTLEIAIESITESIAPRFETMETLEKRAKKARTPKKEKE